MRSPLSHSSTFPLWPWLRYYFRPLHLFASGLHLLVRRARLSPAAYSRESRAPEGTGAHKYAQIPFSNNNFSISASRTQHQISLFPLRCRQRSACIFRSAQGEKQNKQPAAAAVQSRTAVFEPINQQAARFHYSSIWLITAAACKHSPCRHRSLCSLHACEMKWAAPD